jgi:hypothetical protein
MEIKLDSYTKTNLKPKDYPSKPTGKLVDHDCIVYGPDGQVILLYKKAPKQIVDLARHLGLNTKPDKNSRTRGLPQASSVFGVLPRNAIREDYCRFSAKSKQEKTNFAYALELNKLVAAEYKRLLPENYNQALQKVEESIQSCYRLVQTPWTNLNVNLNQVIKYHKDSGNIKIDMSNVLIVKNGCIGGYLDCPELGLTLAQDDGFMVFFKGQEILHGVTPCRFLDKSSYRCSIVSYTLDALKNCYPYEQELERLRLVKTEQAKNKKQKLAQLRQTYKNRLAKQG